MQLSQHVTFYKSFKISGYQRFHLSLETISVSQQVYYYYFEGNNLDEMILTPYIVQRSVPLALVHQVQTVLRDYDNKNSVTLLLKVKVKVLVIVIFDSLRPHGL